MAEKRFFPLAAAQLNLKRLLLIRLIVLACQLIGILYAFYFLDLRLNYTLITGILALVVAVNIFVAFRVKQKSVVSNQELLGHLLFDVLSLSVLIYMSGGANNPFVSFFLVPITISAAILPWTYTWLVAGISLVAYTILLFYFQPLPALMPADMHMTETREMPSLHIVGMWFNFLASAVLITYFVVKMATEIRAQEQTLNDYREENLRNEQILAVATQAAGTAHELGTPLNTMTLLINEIADVNPDNKALQEDVAVLKDQLEVCRTSLKDLVSRADPRQAGNAIAMPLSHFIDQIEDQWRLLRPEVDLQVIVDKINSPRIQVDAPLQQAVVNILNNAADASPDRVELTATWDESSWTLAIRDYGEGVNEDILSTLGSEIGSNKEQGMGVGMILTQATVNRLGGKVLIKPHPETGTVTSIILPMATDG